MGKWWWSRARRREEAIRKHREEVFSQIPAEPTDQLAAHIMIEVDPVTIAMLGAALMERRGVLLTLAHVEDVKAARQAQEAAGLVSAGPSTECFNPWADDEEREQQDTSG